MDAHEFANLTESDKGRPVKYESGYPDTKAEFGILSSWNDIFAFVRFGDNASGHACQPEFVTFLPKAGEYREVKPILSSVNDQSGWISVTEIEGDDDLMILVGPPVEGDIAEHILRSHIYMIDKEAPMIKGAYIIDGNIWQSNHVIRKLNSEEEAKNCRELRDIMRKRSAEVPDKLGGLMLEVITITTDPKLIVDGIPSISEEFIREFVMQRGKGKIVVEMDYFPHQKSEGISGMGVMGEKYYPKADSNGNASVVFISDNVIEENL